MTAAQIEVIQDNIGTAEDLTVVIMDSCEQRYYLEQKTALKLVLYNLQEAREKLSEFYYNMYLK